MTTSAPRGILGARGVSLPPHVAARAHSPGYTAFDLELSTAQQQRVSPNVLFDRAAGGFARPWKTADGSFRGAS